MILDPVKVIDEYVRFPSVSADPAFADGMAGARDYVADLLQQMGFMVDLVKTPLHPVVLAERKGKPEWPGIVIYGHYDVQPPDPLPEWTTPPFAPRIHDGRIYGRGAADNKGPQAVILAALSKVLAERPDLPLRVTVLIEGEEEIGSPSFNGFIKDYRERLQAHDMIVLSDTGSPDAQQIVVTTGLRGLVALEVKVKGSRTDLHSGVHGGAVMNPVRALTGLLASLHDADNRVNVPCFYDNVREPEDWERDELKKYPLDEAQYRDFLQVPAFAPEKGYTPFEAVRFRPTLEFNGIGGGYQGEGSKTVIPREAFAKITCRLVADQDPERILRLVTETLQARCPEGVQVEVKPGDTGLPYAVTPPRNGQMTTGQAPLLTKAFGAAEKAIADAFGRPPLFIREGGSVPIIGDLKKTTGLDSLMIGLFTPADNLHAPDESFDLEMAEKGVAAYEKLFLSLAGV